MTTCSDYDFVDIAIIGAGPAGLSAGLYGARAGLNTIVFGDPYASQLAKADPVQNFLTWTTSSDGTGSPSGLEIIESMISHGESVGMELLDIEVKQISRDSSGHFHIYDEKGDSSCANTVILATGTKHRKLGIKGEEQYYGKGVGYCTICDGPLYKDQNVAITGYGNEMIQAALRMAIITSELHVVSTRPNIGADPSLIDQVESFDNVTIHHNARPQEILGDEDGITSYLFSHDGHECQIDVQAVFIEVGVLPSSAIASGVGIELNGNFVKVDRTQSTNIPGFYAAGDITGGIARQAIVSAGDGARAAISAMDYIKKEGLTSSKIKSVQWGSAKGAKKKLKKTKEKSVKETATESDNMLINYVNSDDGFKSQYSRYNINQDIIDAINENIKSLKLVTISAYWCPDCRRNVPRMAKISEYLADNLEIIVEDRDKDGIIEKYNVKKIPTFIFYDANSEDELGRIIEKPKYHELEEDILKIIQGKY